MAPTLFEILTDPAPARGVGTRKSADDELLLSIRDHLQRLFNARRRSLPHLPHYGLPDVAAVFEALPYSLDGLVLAVRQCIDTFDSRLTQVQIRPLQALAGSGSLRLEISGRTRCGKTPRYLAVFYSNGRAELEYRAEGACHG